MTSHPVSALDLSAYRDRALDAYRRQLVESHIQICSACRERLAGYAWLGSALQSTAHAPVPAAVDERVAALVRSRSEAGARLRLPRPWAPRQAWAAAAVAVILAVALLIGLPGRDGTFGPTVASAYLFDDQGTPAIRVQFSGEVNRETVAESLRIEPAVPVEITWRGSDMVVKPSEPLQPSGRYTLSVNPAGRDRAATPVALQFTGDPPGTPVLLVAQRAPSPSSLLAAAATAEETATPTATEAAAPSPTETEAAAPAPTESETPTPAPLPSPSSTPDATPTPPHTSEPTPSPTPAEPQPWIGLALFLENNPEVAVRLGKAKGKEEATDLVVQRFQKGLLVWRADTGTTLLLADGVDWQSYPAMGRPSIADSEEATLPGPISRLLERNPGIRSTLGVATSSALPAAGVAQGYQHGTVLWISGGTVLVLHNRGPWEEYPDGDGEERTPTPTPTPTLTATLEAMSTATPVSIETAIPTAAPAATAPPGGDDPTPTATATAEPASGGITPTPLETATLVEGGEPTSTPAPTSAPSPTLESEMTGGSS